MAKAWRTAKQLARGANWHKSLSIAAQAYRERWKVAARKYVKAGFKPLTDLDMSRTVRIFDIAKEAPLPLIVLGPSPMLWHPTLVQNFRPIGETVFLKGMDNPKWADLKWKKSSTELEARLELDDLEQTDPLFGLNGSLMMEVNWSMPLNDGLIAGAASGRKELHIASPDMSIYDLPDKALWNSVYDAPTVLGRELSIARILGYEQAINPYKDLGIVLHQPKQQVLELDL